MRARSFEGGRCGNRVAFPLYLLGRNPHWLPLQLISRQLVQDSSLEDGKAPTAEADGGEDIPF